MGHESSIRPAFQMTRAGTRTPRPGTPRPARRSPPAGPPDPASGSPVLTWSPARRSPLAGPRLAPTPSLPVPAPTPVPTPTPIPAPLGTSGHSPGSPRPAPPPKPRGGGRSRAAAAFAGRRSAARPLSPSSGLREGELGAAARPRAWGELPRVPRGLTLTFCRELAGGPRPSCPGGNPA